jgi:glutamate synthase-like protein
MGSDTPLAVLSERPQLLYNYFKQLFAQITNPPVDAIREELIMSTDTTVGPEANMLEPTEECAKLIKLGTPILTNDQLAKLRHLEDADNRFGHSSFSSITLPMLYDLSVAAPVVWKGPSTNFVPSRTAPSSAALASSSFRTAE